MRIKTLLLFFIISILVPSSLLPQFIQQGPKLVGTGAIGNGIEQGISVAISADGNTAIEGGFDDNNGVGAVWIFIRNGNLWSQQGPKLVGNDAIGNSRQGCSVSISSDGNTIAFGGYSDANYIGAVWIFIRNNGIWTQQGSKLVGTGSTGSEQGYSVSISANGNTLVEGGPIDNSETGAAWIFTRIGNVWTQQGAKLVGSGAVGYSQQSIVAISSDGNNFIIGGYGDNESRGAVWIFIRNGNLWSQQGPKLVGNDTSGIGAMGTSVSMSSNGNSVAFGAPSDNGNLGAVWIFIRNGGIWTQQGPKLVGTGAVGQAYIGIVAISSDGNTTIIGGAGDSNYTGAFWVFKRNGSIWLQQGQKYIGLGTMGHSYLGNSVAISSDGSSAIIGGPADSSGAGAVWIFHDPSIGIISISNGIPKSFSLSQNYPNPFNPSTSIKFDIPKSGIVTLKIYDILGKEIYSIIEFKSAGQYEFTFDASNYASGLYFYKLESGTFTETRKMVLIK